MDTAFAHTRSSRKILVVRLNPDAENQSSHSSAGSCTGEEGGRKPTVPTSDCICQCGSQVRALKNQQAFPTNTAPTPLELTHLTLLLCAAESGENSAGTHVCGCAHVCLCMSCQAPNYAQINKALWIPWLWSAWHLIWAFLLDFISCIINNGYSAHKYPLESCHQKKELI